MKLSLVERETILLYNQAEPMTEVYTHDPRLMEKLELLAKKHPDQQFQLLHQTRIVGIDLSHWFCLVIEENGFPFH